MEMLGPNDGCAAAQERETGGSKTKHKNLDGEEEEEDLPEKVKRLEEENFRLEKELLQHNKMMYGQMMPDDVPIQSATTSGIAMFSHDNRKINSQVR